VDGAVSLGDLALRVTTQRRVVSFVSKWGRGGAVSHGPANARAFALTFDDGPHAVWTPRVLDVLDEIGARATFFVVGRNVALHPEIVRETRKRGHEIGSHLFEHGRDVVYDDQVFDAELRRSLGQLQDLLGERVAFLRFPYGEKGSQRPGNIARKYGVSAVHWTFSSHDGFADVDDVVSRVDAGLRPGAIVLMHDCLADEGRGLGSTYHPDRTVTCEALPRIVANARKKRLGSSVTLSDLLDRPKGLVGWAFVETGGRSSFSAHSRSSATASTKTARSRRYRRKP
jgi:peptidoglycan/xylan/chitin deacetylase (PgdA/CDA1 family)